MRKSGERNFPPLHPHGPLHPPSPALVVGLHHSQPSWETLKQSNSPTPNPPANRPRAKVLLHLKGSSLQPGAEGMGGDPLHSRRAPPRDFSDSRVFSCDPADSRACGQCSSPQDPWVWDGTRLLEAGQRSKPQTVLQCLMKDLSDPSRMCPIPGRLTSSPVGWPLSRLSQTLSWAIFAWTRRMDGVHIIFPGQLLRPSWEQGLHTLNVGWGCINSIYQKLLSLDQMLPHCSYSGISAYFSPRILAGPPGTRHRGEGHSPVAAGGRRRRSQSWMRAVSMSPLPSLLLEGSTSSLRGGQGDWEGARFAQRALGSPDSSLWGKKSTGTWPAKQQPLPKHTEGFYRVKGRGQPGLRREGNQTLRPSDSGRVLSQGSVHCPPWLSA